MAKILIRLPRFTEVNGEQRCVAKQREWFIFDPSKDWHTDFGIIPTDILQKDGLHKMGKEELCVFEATPGDHYRQTKREVQLITLKDLGFISSYVGTHKDMIFAEAGTGSGGATCYFAPLVKQVFSYDIRDGAAKKVTRDLERLNISNVTLKTADVCNAEQIDCDVDVFLLDCPEPWRAWESMVKSVKLGGWVVGYTPNTNQLHQLVNDMPKEFIKVHACEVIERHWKVNGRVVRPDSADFSHTAFLSFFRRVQ